MWVRESRCYENNVCNCRLTHQFLLDDDVTLRENIVFVLGSYDHFSPFPLSVVIMSSSNSSGVGRVNRWTRKASEQRRETYYYEALAFSRHNINLVFDEETHKGARQRRHWSQYPENEYTVPGINSRRGRSSFSVFKPSWAMLSLERIRRHTRYESLSKMTKRGSRGREVTCLRHCLSHEFYSNSDKKHRATPDDEFTQAWFDYDRSSFPQSVRKTDTNVELFKVPPYQCSTLFNNIGFLWPEKWIPETREPVTRSEKFNVACVSPLKEYLGNNYAHVILTAEADSLSTDEKKLLEDNGLMGYSSSRINDLWVHARIDSTGYVRHLWESSEEDDKKTHAAIFEINLVRRQKELWQIRESEQLIRFIMTWSLLYWSLKVPIPMSLRTAMCIRQNSFKTSRRDNWWPDQVFKDYGVTYVISFISRRWLHLLLLNSFSRQYFNKYTTSRSMSLLEMSIRQHTDITKSKYSKICANLQLSLYWERCNVRSIRDVHLKVDFILINIPKSFFSVSLSKRSRLLLHDYSLRVKSTWTQNYENILETIRVSERRITRNVRPRERRQYHDCTWRLWCPSIWTSLWAPKQRSLDKTNRFVWALPYSFDYSWESFRNYRGRSSEKLKGREDEIEEVKKHKTLKIRDEDWNSAKWKQTWTWTTVSSSSSYAWREWSSDQTREHSGWQSPADRKSSDQTRERSYWQSADLDSSDQAREATTWQSKNTWQ